MENKKNARLRREADILERLENVKRLIQMETTLLAGSGSIYWTRYRQVGSDGKQTTFGSDLLHELRDTIQLQLLSIAALCYGDNPDIGEPMPMLEWKQGADFAPEDEFRDAWRKCLEWNG